MQEDLKVVLKQKILRNVSQKAVLLNKLVGSCFLNFLTLNTTYKINHLLYIHFHLGHLCVIHEQQEKQQLENSLFWLHTSVQSFVSWKKRCQVKQNTSNVKRKKKVAHFYFDLKIIFKRHSLSDAFYGTE